jgi:hypothetical protein
VSDVGRYVILERGDIDWKWKFAFGRQCSNFGAILKDLEKVGGAIQVERFIGDVGEYVWMFAGKDDLMKAIEKWLESGECPFCDDPDCLRYSREMMMDFKNTLEKLNKKSIEALWFVEY